MKYLYKFLTISAVFLFSCEDVLEKEPIDIIDAGAAFQEAEDIEAGTVGVYALISGVNYIGISSRISDDLRLSPENRGQGVQIHDWSYVATEGATSGAWLNIYGVNARLNRVLNAIDELVGSGVVTEEEVARNRAELLAIRAMCHFDLWRLFSTKYDPNALAIPYIALPEGLRVDNLPDREPTASVFEEINADLAAAKALMPTDVVETTRFTSLAISALQARVALYSEQWQDAVDFSTEVINNADLAQGSELDEVFADESEAGVLFKLLRVSGDGRIGTLYTDVNNDIFFNPSNEILGIYDKDNDARFDAYLFEDEDGDRDEVIKYPGKPGLDKLNDVKILRVAEQYLIRAEAQANLNQFTQASADINTLRSSRITGYVDQNYTNTPDVVEEVLLERRRELAYEGHRFFDLKRLGLPIDRINDDCFRVPNACTMEAESFLFALPIPQDEIFASDMTQNPGYTSN